MSWRRKPWRKPTPMAALAGHRLAAVVICSPTLAHYEQVCAAFDHGLDVLCEKPLAAGRAQIVDLIDRQKEQGRILSISYQRRYKSAYLTARRELTERADWYGPLKQVHIFVCERWQQTIAGTWRDDPNIGAGYFGDAGSHQIDVTYFITGQQAESVLATSDKRGSRVEIVTQVMARLSGGVGPGRAFRRRREPLARGPALPLRRGRLAGAQRRGLPREEQSHRAR